MKRFLKWFAFTFASILLIAGGLAGCSYFIEPTSLFVSKIDLQVHH